MSQKVCPYIGPSPFRRENQKLFFGRWQEADDLLSLVIAYRVVLVYAQSGAGKTSLLDAGLSPLLEKEGMEVLPLARVKGESLQNQDSPSVENIYMFNVLSSWMKTKDLNVRNVSLAAFLAALPRQKNSYGQPAARVLIFDQFEEFFTAYSERREERQKFFRQIRVALDEDLSLRIIFAMREEFIAELDQFSQILPDGFRARLRLERLRYEAAVEAVKRPLIGTKRVFGDNVAENIVEDLLKAHIETLDGKLIQVKGEFVEPLHLQIVCSQLWNNLDSEITKIEDRHRVALGDVDQALGNFYERVILIVIEMADVEEEKVRSWCEKVLITSSDTRAMVHRGPDSTGELPNVAVDVLERERVIRMEQRAGARWYELTHDRFIRPIQISNREWREKVYLPTIAKARARKSFLLSCFPLAIFVLFFILSYVIPSRQYFLERDSKTNELILLQGSQSGFFRVVGGIWGFPKIVVPTGFDPKQAPPATYQASITSLAEITKKLLTFLEHVSRGVIRPDTKGPAIDEQTRAMLVLLKLRNHPLLGVKASEKIDSIKVEIVRDKDLSLIRPLLRSFVESSADVGKNDDVEWLIAGINDGYLPDRALIPLAVIGDKLGSKAAFETFRKRFEERGGTAATVRSLSEYLAFREFISGLGEFHGRDEAADILGKMFTATRDPEGPLKYLPRKEMKARILKALSVHGSKRAADHLSAIALENSLSSKDRSDAIKDTSDAINALGDIQNGNSTEALFDILERIKPARAFPREIVDAIIQTGDTKAVSRLLTKGPEQQYLSLGDVGRLLTLDSKLSTEGQAEITAPHLKEYGLTDAEIRNLQSGSASVLASRLIDKLNEGGAFTTKLETYFRPIASELFYIKTGFEGIEVNFLVQNQEQIQGLDKDFQSEIAKQVYEALESYATWSRDLWRKLGRWDNRPLKVVINPAHLEQEGEKGAFGLEASSVLNLALKIQRSARKNPNILQIKLTRITNSRTPLERRLNVVDEVGPDIILDLHVTSTREKETKRAVLLKITNPTGVASPTLFRPYPF